VDVYTVAEPAADQLKTYLRPFAELENGLLCIQPYYDVAAGISIKAPPPKRM